MHPDRYSGSLPKVSQAWVWPVWKPLVNQRTRCSEVPCVNAFRHHAALRLLLQGVVADGGRRAQAFLDVARLQTLLHGVGAVGPHAGEAIGLQFHAHL